MQSKQQGYVFWITGLSGMGKSTFAYQLHSELEQHHISNILIDGDIIRSIFGKSHYDRESRIQTAYHYSKLAYFLSKQGMNTICATISLFHEVQQWNRDHILNYYEILIQRNFQQVMQEDCKGIYKEALLKDHPQVVGLDIQPEYPKHPYMIVNNATIESLSYYTKKILEIFKETP